MSESIHIARARVCECVRECVRVRVHVRVCLCVSACVWLSLLQE